MIISSYEQVEKDVRSWVKNMNDPGMTGFVNWPQKQKLYRLRKFIDEALTDAPTFAGEKEWLIEEKLDS